MSNFRTIDRTTGYLLPASVDEWLPEKHLARFIVDVIDDRDLGRMSRAHRGTGSASYHPRIGRDVRRPQCSETPPNPRSPAPACGWRTPPSHSRKPKCSTP